MLFRLVKQDSSADWRLRPIGLVDDVLELLKFAVVGDLDVAKVLLKHPVPLLKNSLVQPVC